MSESQEENHRRYLTNPPNSNGLQPRSDSQQITPFQASQLCSFCPYLSQSRKSLSLYLSCWQFSLNVSFSDISFSTPSPCKFAVPLPSVPCGTQEGYGYEGIPKFDSPKGQSNDTVYRALCM